MERPEHDSRSARDRWLDRWPDPAAVLDGLGVQNGTTVAAVGEGLGDLAVTTAERVAPRPVYVVDPDGTRLDELDVVAVERGVETLATVSGAIENLAEHLPERVDAVLVAVAGPEVGGIGQLAEQGLRSLRPGGRLLIVTRPDEADGSESSGGAGSLPRAPDALRRGIEPVGFRLVSEVDLPPDHVGLVFARAHDP